MAEPVSITQIKKHLDVLRDDQDEMLTGMGIAAREWVEGHTGLILTRREVTEISTSFDELGQVAAWPLPVAPETTLQYVDSNGVEQALTGFTIRAWSRPARIAPAAGSRWPSGGPVSVTFLAGYATPADVPYAIKAAILLLVGNLYANRESTVTGTIVGDTGTIEQLCRPFRLPVIG